MLSIESCGFFSVDFFVARNEYCHLGAVMVSNCENRVVPLSNGKFRDEVQCNSFKRKCFWSRIYGIEGCACRTSVDFVSLAFSASPSIVGDFFL